MVSCILEHRAQRATVYYFADLAGAGIGSFLFIPLIPVWEPPGLIFFCVLLTLAAAALFSYSSGKQNRWGQGLVSALFLLFLGASIFLPGHASSYVHLNVHVPKRAFARDLERGRTEATAWSALSRVDIASFQQNRKRVWIAGGVNKSSIAKFNGDCERLLSERSGHVAHAMRMADHHVYPT